MDTDKQIGGEHISALMDGELSVSDLHAVLQLLEQEDPVANDWHAYHLVGDVLRSNALAPDSADLAFLTRLDQRLQQESPPQWDMGVVESATLPTESAHTSAANGPWRWVAGVALSLVLVGGVSLSLWPQEKPASQAQLAASPESAPTAVATGDGAVMLRDPELDALMAAHQQLGGHSAWQMPSGFLRNATYERPSR